MLVVKDGLEDFALALLFLSSVLAAWTLASIFRKKPKKAQNEDQGVVDTGDDLDHRGEDPFRRVSNRFRTARKRRT